jgi:hypothetical protein
VRIDFAPGPPSVTIGTLAYLVAECSFCFTETPVEGPPPPPDPWYIIPPARGQVMLTLDTLGIAVNITQHTLRYVEGYHPHGSWVLDDIDDDWTPEHGELTVSGLEDLNPGTGYGVLERTDWHTRYDPRRGLVHVHHNADEDDIRVAIADGTVVGVRKQQVNSVWLRPRFDQEPTDFFG